MWHQESIRTLEIQSVIQHLLHHSQASLESIQLDILMHKSLVPKGIFALQVLVAQPGRVERDADLVKDV